VSDLGERTNVTGCDPTERTNVTGCDPTERTNVTGCDLAGQIADRLAVQDVVRRYFELVDTKAWGQFDEVLTEDTTARWTADSMMQGRLALVAATRHMVGGDEVVTFHHVATMSPVIEGDTAEVTARVRAMHYGLGPRQGKFYESLAVQPTRLLRTAAGWRISHHDWNIVVKLGSMEDLFAPEIAAGKKY
jgi:ketosteroid isomerase-like protein